MKNTILIAVLLATELLFTQHTNAQGTLYVSNLAQPTAGSTAVGSDSWLGVEFTTGTNVGGYSLDSVQLFMASATGSPSDFTVYLYSFDRAHLRPGINLGVLAGADPTTDGIFLYTASGITLASSTGYVVVLTSGSPVATGSYLWNLAATTSYTSSDGWGIGSGIMQSGDGLNWSFARPFPFQFGVNASAIPEPTQMLLALLGLALLRFRWQKLIKHHRNG